MTVESSWLHCGEGETVTLVCRVYSNPVARVSKLFLYNIVILL